MELRVRAAVILVENGKTLLVKHADPHTGDQWWIPPGGGLLPEDQSIIDCAQREIFEETSLNVTVGKLVYLREFIEESAAVRHIELFFLADDFSGELSLENIKGKGQDEELIQELAWLSQDEMRGLVIYPELLVDEFWEDLSQGFPLAKYIGVQHES